MNDDGIQRTECQGARKSPFQMFIDQINIEHQKLDRRILLDHVKNKSINEEIIQWFILHKQINMADYDIIVAFMCSGYEEYVMRYINLEFYSNEEKQHLAKLSCDHKTYDLLNYLLNNGIIIHFKNVRGLNNDIMQIIINHVELFQSGTSYINIIYYHYFSYTEPNIDHSLVYKFVSMTCPESDLFSIFYNAIIYNSPLFHEFVSNNYMTVDIINEIKNKINDVLVHCTDESIIKILIEMRIVTAEYIGKYNINHTFKQILMNTPFISKVKRAAACS
jgi:hypothetical protein